MNDYTGPITVVTFVGPRDSFALTFHTAVEDLDSIEKIVARYAEDGYKPDLSNIRRWYMVNGTMQERQPKLGPIGFRSRSAFLKA
jgi:hypothetical protein